MILSDKTLQAMLSAGTLTITPLIEDQIQPASVDIRLGNTFSVVEDSPSGIINMENEIHYKTITSESYILLPNQFVLATTMEYFDLPDDLTAFVCQLVAVFGFFPSVFIVVVGFGIRSASAAGTTAPAAAAASVAPPV